MSRSNLIGSSSLFRQTLQTIHRFAAVDATVLISGESGTGKELAARTIHYLGTRSDRPFVPVNCGVLSDSLMESELFGHERGAFTDARRSHSGLVGEAHGGTLFLDEVDTLTPRAQGALLRFLQEKTYRRVGGTGQISADVRVITASNADLEALVEAKRFRQDLLFRLNVLHVALPPLREREVDAVELALAYVGRLCRQYDISSKRLSEEALALITQYSWPGNVRELENLLLRDFLMSDGDLMHCAELRMKLTPRAGRGGERHLAEFNEAKARTVHEFERRYLTELMARSGGNVSRAARMAGKERSAFGKLLRKHGIRASQSAHAGQMETVDRKGVDHVAD